MHRLQPLPDSFEIYRGIGGVVTFDVFEDAEDSEDAALSAICSVLPDADVEALRAISCRPIDDSSFYGEWYDTQSDSLLLIGDYEFSDGTTRINPRLRDLADLRAMRGGAPLSEPGKGGEFAYAFSHPPYRLRTEYPNVQWLFDKIRQVILPPRHPHKILDWTSPDLRRVSPVFEAGMEWWGVFLFSVAVPELRRLTVIAASTTD